MATDSRNRLLREACQHFRGLATGPIDQDTLELLILHQMELRDEAKRQYKLCQGLGFRVHWMQPGALSEIVGWTERSIEYMKQPGLTLKHQGGNQLHHLDGSSTPALVVDWMFSELGQWMNHELLNGPPTEHAVAT